MVDTLSFGMDLEELLLDSNLSQDSKQKRVLELKNLSEVILEQRKKRSKQRNLQSCDFAELQFPASQKSRAENRRPAR